MIVIMMANYNSKLKIVIDLAMETNSFVKVKNLLSLFVIIYRTISS